MTIQFREARQSDLNSIVEILRDDFLAKKREVEVGAPCYQKAFDDISADINQYLMVAEKNQVVVGTCHLTIMPSLTFSGRRRLNVEAVRIVSTERGQRIGEKMFAEIKKVAMSKECHMVQLACINVRKDAMRFYEQIGFKPTHTGYKMAL